MKKLSSLERFEKYNKIPLLIRQQRRINTLEGKLELYEETLKEDLLELLKELQDAPFEAKRLKIENKRLRKQVKELKEKIKG